MHIYSVFALPSTETNTEIKSRSQSVEAIANNKNKQSRSMKYNIENLTDKNSLFRRLISEKKSETAKKEILTQALLSKAVYNGFSIVKEKKSNSESLKKIKEIKRDFDDYIAQITRVEGSKSRHYWGGGKTEEDTKESIINKISQKYKGEQQGTNSIGDLMFSLSNDLSSPLDKTKDSGARKTKNKSEIKEIIDKHDVQKNLADCVNGRGLGTEILKNKLNAAKNEIDSLYKEVEKASIKQYLDHFYSSVVDEVSQQRNETTEGDEQQVTLGQSFSAVLNNKTHALTVFERYDNDAFEVLDYCNRTPTDSETESAVLLRNKKTGDLQVVFMGTKSKSDWLHNINIQKEGTNQLDTHSGFLAVSDYAIQQFNHTIEKYMDGNKEAKLFVTGHSLGGAAAQVFASSYLDDNIKKARFENSKGRVVLVTFGQPASKHRNVIIKDDKNFAGNYVRVFNKSDMVVHCLPNPGRVLKKLTGYEYNTFYDHGGLSLRLTERNYWNTARKTVDKLYAHSMEQILSDLRFSLGLSESKPNDAYDPIANAKKQRDLTKEDIKNIKRLDDIRKTAFTFDDKHNFTLNDIFKGKKLDKSVVEDELNYFFKQMLDENVPQYNTKGTLLSASDRSLRLISFTNTILRQNQYNLHGVKAGEWVYIAYRYLVDLKNKGYINPEQYKQYRNEMIESLGKKEVVTVPTMEDEAYKNSDGTIIYSKYCKDVQDRIDSSVSVSSLYNTLLKCTAAKSEPINEGNPDNDRLALKQISAKLYTFFKQQEDIARLKETLHKEQPSSLLDRTNKKTAIDSMGKSITELDNIIKEFKNSISTIYNNIIYKKLNTNTIESKCEGISLACDLHALNKAFGHSIGIDLSQHRTYASTYASMFWGSTGPVDPLEELMNIYNESGYSTDLQGALKNFLSRVPAGGEHFNKIKKNIEEELRLVALKNQSNVTEGSAVQQDVTDKNNAPAVSAKEQESSSKEPDLIMSTLLPDAKEVAPAVSAKEQELSETIGEQTIVKVTDAKEVAPAVSAKEQELSETIGEQTIVNVTDAKEVAPAVSAEKKASRYKAMDLSKSMILNHKKTDLSKSMKKVRGA